MIENVQKIKAELQVALLPEPGQVVVFQHARIRLEHSRVAIDITRLSAFRSLSRLGKVCSRKESVDVGRAAVDPVKFCVAALGMS